MKIKELVSLLNAYNPDLPVCFFVNERQEYFEIDDDGSIEKVWDENSCSWILSLNENNDSLEYRLHDIDDEV
jgi:hypothetical protein